MLSGLQLKTGSRRNIRPNRPAVEGELGVASSPRGPVPWGASGSVRVVGGESPMGMPLTRPSALESPDTTSVSLVAVCESAMTMPPSRELPFVEPWA